MEPIFNKIKPPEVIRRSNWRDRYETKVNHWITPWDGVEKIDVGIVGAPLSKAAISFSGAFGTPNALRLLFPTLTTYNVDEDIDLSHLSVKDLGDISMHITDVLQCHQNIEEGLTELATRFPEIFPVVIGGDHSITCPSVKAFKKKFQGEIGLIQFDSHFDVRNLDDGGPTNGTPIRNLIESGTLKGENIVQIGIHNFTNSKPYRDYVEEKGITFYTSRQVHREGIDSILNKAIEKVSRNTEAIYVTVDIDVLDQAYAPGAAAVVAAGMSSWDLLDAVTILGEQDKVLGLDIVCVDPMQDIRQSTVRTAAYVLLHFLTGYAKRRAKS
jgi:formiminoglutamase